MLNQEGYALFVKGGALQPEEFGALINSLCAEDSEPGCAYRFVDMTGVCIEAHPLPVAGRRVVRFSKKL
jgi:hypothetical protein